jgi:hypothetical protein
MLPPKTRRSRRPIPLADTASKSLRRQKAMQATQRREAGDGWNASFGDLVFTNPQGGALDPSNLRRRLYRVEKDLTLPRVGPNYLGRHGCASFLADQNVPPAVAMAILGHRTSVRRWRSTLTPSRSPCERPPKQSSGRSHREDQTDSRRAWEVRQRCPCQIDRQRYADRPARLTLDLMYPLPQLLTSRPVVPRSFRGSIGTG